MQCSVRLGLKGKHVVNLYQKRFIPLDYNVTSQIISSSCPHVIEVKTIKAALLSLVQHRFSHGSSALNCGSQPRQCHEHEPRITVGGYHIDHAPPVLLLTSQLSLMIYPLMPTPFTMYILRM